MGELRNGWGGGKGSKTGWNRSLQGSPEILIPPIFRSLCLRELVSPFASGADLPPRAVPSAAAALGRNLRL